MGTGHTISENINIPTKRNCVYLFCLLFFSLCLKAQVYNYEPIRNSNLETNPAALASSLYSRAFFDFTQHMALLSENRLSTSIAKLAFKLPGNVAGCGLSISHTRVNDTISYQSAAFGLGYRVIIFNSLQLRLGALYKGLLNNASGGRFQYGYYSPDSLSRRKTELIHNMNFSFSVTSAQDKLFLTAGLLNYSIPTVATEGNKQFPIYAYLCLGDLGKLFLGPNKELNYTMIVRKFNSDKFLPPSHHINFMSSLMAITRASLLMGGMRLGAVENKYLQICPRIDFFHLHLRKRKYIRFGFMYDLGFNIKTLKKEYAPATQFNISISL